ncbi:MAG: membrane protein insertase YidC [Deltaproteobacteria bacterium]|nr:membrane protein insertase YidC [Deltaproteobacteria bacterium]
MDKRVLIAVILSVGILFFYPYIIQKIYPPQKPRAVQQEAAVKAPESGAPVSAGHSASVSAPAVKEDLTTVETPLFKAVFTSAGGGVKSFELKRYRAALKADAPVENIANTVALSSSFKTHITSNGVSESVAFRPSSTGLVLKDKDTAELIYAGVAKSGLKVEKKYVFTAGSYLIHTELKIDNPSANPFAGRADITLVSNLAGKDASGYHTGPIVDTKDKLIRQGEKEALKSGSEKLKWIGLEDKYFLSAIIPRTDTEVTWAAEIPAEKSSTVSVQVPLNLAPGAVAAYSYNTFLGPKEYDLLVKQNIGLEEAIEFGWFGFMAKPLLVVLNFFQRYFGNYGIAIIVITVIIKILFYPLTKHSLKSMKEMQKIQPQLAALKEKYKDNKEKLNKEMMELYKRYKINPVGGCLPMVLQIPVFIALYEVLYVAIELRHAPLFLWIKDLSDKDPYYITPIVMGATMFIQQKMTPSTVDPSQAKIMLIMPIIFTFMFLNFPSGLVIYWLVNNVLSIAQQYYIQRTPSPAKA